MRILKYAFFAGMLMPAIHSSAQQSKIVLPLPESLIRAGAMADVSRKAAGGPIELVDLSADSLVLGYVSAKADENARVAIVTPVSKQEWFQASIGDVAQRSVSSRGVSSLLVINDVSAGRTSAGNYVRMKAVVYESPGGANSYQPVNRIDTFLTDNSAETSNIGSILSLVLNASATTVSGGIARAGSGIPQTREQVIAREKERYAFISNGIFPSGIYLSYEDFKMNKPSFAQFYVKKDEAGKIGVYSFTEADSTLHAVDPWGIATNNELYVLREGALYAAEAVGSGLVLSKYIDPAARRNNGEFWRLNFGKGNEDWNAGNPFDNRYTIRLENYRNKGVSGEAIRLDPETGTPEM